MTRCFSHGDRGVLGVSVSATNKWHAKVELQAVADPDLQIRWGGGSHPDPEIRGGWSPKKYFRPFRPHFGLKMREDPGPPAPPLDLPLAGAEKGIKTKGISYKFYI